jgi:hypothetical protein
MNLPGLNRRQQLLLAGAALVIVGIQLYQFAQREIAGTGWVLSFTVAALLLTWALQRSSAGTSPAQPNDPARQERRRYYLIAVLLAGAVLTAFAVVAVRRSQTASVVDQGAFEKALRELEREREPVATLSLDALLAEYRDNETRRLRSTVVRATRDLPEVAAVALLRHLRRSRTLGETLGTCRIFGWLQVRQRSQVLSQPS